MKDITRAFEAIDRAYPGDFEQCGFVKAHYTRLNCAQLEMLESISGPREVMSFITRAAKYAAGPRMTVKHFEHLCGQEVAVAEKKGYILDGSLGVSHPNATCCVAFKAARAYCAKAYVATKASLAHIERNVSSEVHGQSRISTVIQIVDGFLANQREIIIMPLLSRPVSDLRKHTVAGFVDNHASGVICMSGLSAIAGLATVRLCHADIKPSNLMMCGHLDHVVLIDLASSTRYGEAIGECTNGYSLGLLGVASLQWDLTCLASTIYEISVPEELPATRYELLARLSHAEEASSLGPLLAKLILTKASESTSLTDMQHDIWEPALEIVRSRLGERVAAGLRETWPTPRG